MVPQQQLLLRPIGDFRQRLQQPSVPQHPRQGYHPQPVREYYPQFSVQQYRAQPPVQEGLSQQSIQELVGAAAVQLGYTRTVESPGRAIIVQCANNDKIVIDALKQGKAKGLNGLGAIEKLGNASGHANFLWKNYALARLDKISPKVYSTCNAARSRLSSNRSGPRKGPSSNSQRSQPAASSSNCTGVDNHTNPSCFMDRRLGHDNQAYQPSSIFERDGPPTNVQARSRRGGPIPEYHAGTLIPPLPTSSQPKAPVWDRDDDHEAHRFTDEDKIFFIHFLKSYLLGQACGARIPDREDLYLLLARQTPHHNVEAWKRHWNDAPELPDKIYIEARKRADDEALARSASLSPSSDEEGSEDGSDVEDDGLLKESTSPVLNEVQRRSCTLRQPNRGKRGCHVKVTEEDLRDMAQYKYERRDVWDQSPSVKARWEEFADRPQNGKRSLLGWYTADRDHKDEINYYYKQYAASAAAACDERSELDVESELEYVDVTTPPQHDAESASASSSGSSDPDSQASDEAPVLPAASTVPHKRERTDSETACSLGGAEEDFPATKRMKEEEDEEPELNVFDSD
ncbi:hypothetical protein V8D89_005889 [Ganoderma adspersum]